MVNNPSLKPFVLNTSDLDYLLAQVSFIPLFDSLGNAIIGWDGVGAIFDGHGNQIGTGGLVAGDAAAVAAIEQYGQSYASVNASTGTRDISGLNNNLVYNSHTWGSVDQPFTRAAPANFLDYSKSLASGDANAFYGAKAFAADLSPYVPGPQNLDTVGQNYETTVDGNGVVTQANVVDYTPRMISLTTTTAGATQLLDANNHIVYWNQALYDAPTPEGTAYKALINASGVNIAHLVQGAAITTNYGLLETLGQQDQQAHFQADGSTQTDEFFIGSENPGVSPVNGWFAVFGQFFDHGLDLIGKGGQGTTIKIALAETDPLYGVIGQDGQPTTSITINRATVSGVDANGDPTYVNHTSPFIDQSQTYGSHEQMTNLLREWVSTDGDITWHAGINLFDGDTLVDGWARPDGTITHDTLPTLNELQNHVLATGRDALTWDDVFNLRNRGPDGDVTTGTLGQALILDMNPHFDSAHLLPTNDMVDVDGNSISDVTDAMGILGLSFNSNGDLSNGTPSGVGFNALLSLGLVNPSSFAITAHPMGGYTTQQVHDAVNSILMASVGDHYIAGDGRVNENFALTTIHHVFHEEHNFQVTNLQNAIAAQDAVLADPNHTTLHSWQIDRGNGTDGNGNYKNADGTIAWDETKLFNATKLIVEMEYQHAAVDQYARTITPRIQEFVGYSSGQDSTISLEYSQVAFRFGHSTLRETIDTIDPNHGLTGKIMSFALQSAFLNPQGFAENGPGAIALGMSHQQMNEVDEFITPSLNQGLLGQPLDLAAINIARGRDLGIPCLNEMRGDLGLAKYVSWSDFGANMIHPESLVNFIAAYAFDGDVEKATEIVARANGEVPTTNHFSDAEAISFMNGDMTAGVAGTDSYNLIDAWLGGLAEAHVPGGLLGETFDLIFFTQIESLMDGDRFYYLYRLIGQQMGEEVNNGQFKDIVERNTGLEHLNGSIFAYADQYYDFTATIDNANTVNNNHKYATQLASNPTLGIWSDGGTSTTLNGNIISIGGVQYIRDNRPDTQPNIVHPVEGTPTSGADSHEVMIGSENKDYIHARGGDDTVYGEGGDDIIYGDGGIDRLYGGAGADYIDAGEGPDLVDGGEGDDTIYGRGSGSEVGGFDQLVGGAGNDKIYGGEGVDKLSGGSGDDELYGEGNTDPFTRGGDGNDYIDGGTGGDNLYGDNGDDFVYGNNDQDIVSGGQGDDILRPGRPSAAAGGGPDEVLGGDGIDDSGYGGKVGFDIIDFGDYAVATTGIAADFSTQQNPLTAIDGTTPFPAWAQIEGVVGTRNNDTMLGDDTAVDPLNGVTATGNWLIGGSGNDVMEGAGGNDVIVGDRVRLDTLIGQYSGTYTHEVDGASHRAIGALGDGLLGNSGIGIDTGMFDKHFEEMLRTEKFKDMVLGGDAGNPATGSDTAVFSGTWAQYAIQQINFGSPMEGMITAFKIIDSIAGRDGIDLVLGVENFKFADITVTLANLFNPAPAFASANLDLTVAENVTGTVANIHATDINTPVLTYAIAGGADASLFNIDGLTGALTFVTSPNYEAPTDAGGNHVYDLIVTASDGHSIVPQTVKITVTDVNEFAVSALTDANAAIDSVAENAAVGTVVGVTAFAADADGTNNTVTYSLTNDAGGRFAINAGTGVITVAGPIDREIDGASLNVTVQAMSSDGSTSSQVFAIAITDVNEFAISPVTDVNLLGDGVVENTAIGTVVGVTAYAFDSDATATVSYGLTDSAGGLFSIDANTGIVTVAGAIDREAVGASVNITVEATSSDGTTSSKVFSIAIADVNEVPVSAITDTNAANNQLSENLAAGSVVGITAFATDADATNHTVTYNLSNNAGGRFAINAVTGVVTTLVALDYETTPSHLITVVATSTDGSSSTADYTINVLDVAPVIIDPTGDLPRIIYGTAENDFIFGLGGNDTLIGGALGDALDGGSGTDTASYYTSTSAVTVDLVTPSNNTGDAKGDTYISIERFTLTSFVDTFEGDGFNNYVNGGAGDDVLRGNGGSDTLYGGLGADDMYGGSGHDVFYVDNSGDQVQESVGGGIDKVIASADFTLASLQDVERLSATGGTAAINLTGNEITNTIYGNEGQNTLNGGGGNDYMYGYGGADRLNGGSGIDFLSGGAGADTFVLTNLTADRDRSSDFVSGVDHLEISVANFGGGLVAGSLAATQMSGSATGFALDANDRFAFNAATGRLYYDADGNGVAAREFVLQLDVGDTVVFTDFVLI